MAKILIVEDDPPTLALVKATLEEAGHAVSQAGNGAEAVIAVNSDAPDLILMDIMMPIMNGFQALHVLKSSPMTKDIPVVMLTARSGDVDMAQGWAEGVDFYLTKPFSPKELLTVVKRILPAKDAEA
ncbi:MAG: response regulator [Armatimonadetes bacterium]|nr:response regulator [Armatimonadota bacterium]NIM23033.1 response regulator [Armatimonadota bacterium]NIM66901.1 response regulator [Armatimonadota bacterium]NIM75435.1 response regulator [Armatimonadota bacterium]NIN05092.1 response regulator [Armatimonadota bacterium]